MTSPLAFDLTPLHAHPRAGVVVGLSGGLDSTVLLHRLAQAPEVRARGLRALHVHHGLHPDADDWQRHCKRICRQLDVPLASVRVQVAPAGDGPEAAARRARHAALQATVANGDVVALAHHRDDQAETFLLRALRASGPDGLRAMRAWRAFGGGWLWRPLLGTARSAIHDYALAHALEWLDDPSNADTRFDRNFLRSRVMPLLRERWPDADAALARSAAVCAESADLLDADDASAIALARTDADHVLDVAALHPLPSPRRARVLRRWIAELGLPPLPAEGIRQVDAHLLHARDDACPRFDWHGASIRLWRGLLHAAMSAPALDRDFDVEWSGREALHLPDGGALAFDPPLPSHTTLRVRARSGGERIHLARRAHSHALKHVLQSLHVPPWTREHLPLLRDDEGVLAAGDIVLSARFAAMLDHADSRLVWTRPQGA
jgi:tRNA(Ile)-lysidine synthase